MPVLEWAVDMSACSTWTPVGQDIGHRAVTLMVWSPVHDGTLVVNWSSSHLDNLIVVCTISAFFPKHFPITSNVKG